MIQVKRIYDQPRPEDGRRLLVDRLWPRGMKKEAAALDGWLKEVAPSDALRRWFGHAPDRWDTFCLRYHAELRANPDAWRPILDAAATTTVTLLYGAHDSQYNNAVALYNFLASEHQPHT